MSTTYYTTTYANGITVTTSSPRPKWWDGAPPPIPDWWGDVLDDDAKCVNVKVKDDTVEVDNGTSTTRYKTFSAAPKWMQDKVLKLSMMPQMHTPIAGLGRRCRDGLYQVLVPEHIVSRGGPKPRKKWGRV
jgi:hypothetical protein